MKRQSHIIVKRLNFSSPSSTTKLTSKMTLGQLFSFKVALVGITLEHIAMCASKGEKNNGDDEEDTKTLIRQLRAKSFVVIKE